MKTRTLLLGIAILSAVLGVIINPRTLADDKLASEVAIKIDNFSFSPATIAVPVGTTVRWTNRDDIPHTVVSDEKTFKSKVLDTDQEFPFTFSRPGTYSYFCSIHPHMTGKVVVQ